MNADFSLTTVFAKYVQRGNTENIVNKYCSIEEVYDLSLEDFFGMFICYKNPDSSTKLFQSYVMIVRFKFDTSNWSGYAEAVMQIQPASDFTDKRGGSNEVKSTHAVYNLVSMTKFYHNQDTATLTASESNFPNALIGAYRMKTSSSSRNESKIYESWTLDESSAATPCSKEYWISWKDTADKSFTSSASYSSNNVYASDDTDSTQVTITGGLTCSL